MWQLLFTLEQGPRACHNNSCSCLLEQITLGNLCDSCSFVPSSFVLNRFPTNQSAAHSNLNFLCVRNDQTLIATCHLLFTPDRTHFTPDRTHFTLHRTHFTLHRTHFMLHRTHFALHRTHFTLDWTHFTLDRTHFALHRTHLTLHRTHFTLHRTHFMLDWTLFTLDRTHFMLDRTLFTLDRTHFMLDRTLFTLHRTLFMLHRTHFALHRTHFTLNRTHFAPEHSTQRDSCTSRMTKQTTPLFSSVLILTNQIAVCLNSNFLCVRNVFHLYHVVTWSPIVSLL